MRDPVAVLRRSYGAHPLHLLSLLACFALTGYVLDQLAGNPSLPRILAWFGGAVIAHDLVAFPLYALADRATARVLTGRAGSARRSLRVPVLNYLRVPAAGSALLLLVYLPGIIRQGGPTYRAATGQSQQPFLVRWLLLTAAVFAASAIVYLARLVASRRSRTPDPR
jgi:hypothetical protein